MRYNCAVIGLGNIGFKFSLDPNRKETWAHVEAYKKCTYTKLVGAVEIAPENIQIFESNNPDTPVYSTIQDLFSNQKVDLVSICVPTKEHFSVFSELIKYDLKAIFCEKPLSYSLEESKKMVKFAKDKKIVLAVNYSRRWQNSYNLVRNMIKEGKVGRISAVNAFYPGQIYNIGSHLFDTVIMLTEFEPIMLSAAKINDNCDPSISGWLKCKNDIFVTFSATGKREDLIFEIDIIGDGGRLRIVDNGTKIEQSIFKESKRYSGYRELVAQEVEMPGENDRFIDAIIDIIQTLEGGQEDTRCSGMNGLRVDRIIEKTISSANRNGAFENI